VSQLYATIDQKKLAAPRVVCFCLWCLDLRAFRAKRFGKLRWMVPNDRQAAPSKPSTVLYQVAMAVLSR